MIGNQYARSSSFSEFKNTWHGWQKTTPRLGHNLRTTWALDGWILLLLSPFVAVEAKLLWPRPQRLSRGQPCRFGSCNFADAHHLLKNMPKPLWSPLTSHCVLANTHTNREVRKFAPVCTSEVQETHAKYVAYVRFPGIADVNQPEKWQKIHPPTK